MKRYLNTISLVFSGILFCFNGILFLNKNLYLYRFIHLLIVLGFIVYGISQLINLLARRKKPLILFLRFILSCSYAIAVYHNPIRFFVFIPYFFSLWSLLSSFIQFINFFYVFQKDKLKYRYFVLLDAIANLGFSLLLIADPREHFFIISYLIGIYSLFFGFSEIAKAVNSFYKEKYQHEPLNHIVIPLPIFLTAFIPNLAIRHINKLFSKETSSYEASPSKSVDLEVLVYLRESGFESFGHCDISYKGKIFSYGCHNPHSRKLFGSLGDGILIIADRDSFIQNATNNEKATIIQYGLSLSDSQKNLIKKRIMNLLDRTEVFYSDAALYYQQNNKDNPEINDYLSRVYRHTKSQSFRFTNGKFKTYFVFTTNCVQLADYFLNMKELKLLNISGLITPGTYVEFLNRELEAKNPMIVERNIYTPPEKK